MLKIIIGLICVMISNILLGTSIAKLKKEFSKKKFWNGFFKCLLVIVSVCLMYLCSYLNPTIMIANINDQEVNLMSGIEIIFISGIVYYGFQSLVKLKDLLKLNVDVKEK